MPNEEVSYHHYSLTFPPEEVGRRFAGVRFVLVAGCVHRVEAQVSYLADNLFNGLAAERIEPQLLTKPRSRFALYQVGAVLVSNHGMGSASMSIALHELFVMCRQAQVLDKIRLIRFGTCGGIGVEPGTVCVTERAYDPLLQEFIELKICMRLVRRECVVDLETARELHQVACDSIDKRLGDYRVKLGGTIAANDFYEEQGRTTGAICEHSHEDTLQFLRTASARGIINMEMESNFLAAMCHKLGVKFAVVCVALNNRLADVKVKLTGDQLVQFEERLFHLNAEYLRRCLAQQQQQQQ